MQHWIDGVSGVSGSYEAALAEALGMTLDELAGIALGHEPTSAGWRAFVSGALGQTMTDAERRILAGHPPPPHGRGYSEGYYRTALMNLRSEL